MRSKLKDTIISLLLVLCMVVSMVPVSALAADSSPVDVVADSTEKNDECATVMKEYSAEKVKKHKTNATYPTLDGYLFAGWYTSKECSKETVLGSKTPTGRCYALFVPEDVLGLKAQLSINLTNEQTTDDEKVSLRFVTSVDSVLYKEVGFEISYVGTDGRTYKATSKSNKVYENLYVCGDNKIWEKKPADVFCNLSKYFKICTLKDFTLENFDEIEFTVIPYWVTADDAKVYGASATKSITQGAVRDNVWVSAKGTNGLNYGSQTNPYRTLDYALSRVKEDGIIHLVDTIQIDGENGTDWPKHGKKNVTITDGTLDVTTDDLLIQDGVIFQDMTLQMAPCAEEIIATRNFNQIFAEGNNLTIQEDVTIKFGATDPAQVYGGGLSSDVSSTNMKLYAGTYGHVCGGSKNKNVTGDANLVIGGNTVVNAIYGGGYNTGANVLGNVDIALATGLNPNADWENHDDTTYQLFGGGYQGKVYGDIDITIESDAKMNYIYGGGREANAEVVGTINIKHLGYAYSIYGGGQLGTNSDTHIVMEGGAVYQLFGGSRKSAMNGNSDVKVLGGTVHRRIYGGNYNDYEGTWDASYYVDGYTNVTIGKDASLNLNQGSETGLLAVSRYESAFDKEHGTLIFQDDTYSKWSAKIGSSVFTETSILYPYIQPYDYLVQATVGGEVSSAGECLYIKPTDGNVATVTNASGTVLHYTEGESYYPLPEIFEPTELIVTFSGDTINTSVGYEAKIGSAYYKTIEEAVIAAGKSDKAQIEDLTGKQPYVQITTEQSEYGTLEVDRRYCLVGEQVVITEGKLLNDAYYLAGLLINGEEVALNADKTYTLTTTEKSYEIKGIYKKAIFEANDQWNLLEQNQGTDENGVTSGVVTLPNGGDSNTLYLYRSGTAEARGYDYGDIDLTLKLRDYQAIAGAPRYLIKFVFNGDAGEQVLQLFVDENGRIRTSETTSLPIGSNVLYNFTTEESAAYVGDGIDVRILREGTKLSFYVGEQFKKSLDLTAYIENDTPARVGIIHYYDSGVAVDIPYQLSFPEKETIAGKYLSILGDGISMSAGEPDSSANNTTVSDNNRTAGNTLGIYSSTNELGIGENWTKLYWGQVLTANSMNLLVNNSVHQGLLWSNPAASVASGDALTAFVPGADRTGELDGNKGELSDKDPDVIFLYMGTEDRKQTDLVTNSEAFATRYREAIGEIKADCPNAQIYCFTTMAFYDTGINQNTDYVGYAGIGQTYGSSNKRMTNVNNHIRTIASEYENVTLVDIADIITKENYLEFFPDKTTMITPTVDAHNEIAKRAQKALESQFSAVSNITVQDSEEGTVIASKDSCKVGETVVIKQDELLKDNYYLAGLLVNGEKVKVGANGTYSLTAVETSYEIKGIFKKLIFEPVTSNWDLSDLDQKTDEKGVTSGMVSAPGGSHEMLYLYRTTDEDGVKGFDYGDIDYTMTLRDYAESEESAKYTIRFVFNIDGEHKKYELCVSENDGEVQISNSTNDFGTTAEAYTFIESEQEAYKNQGIDVRILREGIKLSVFVGGEFRKSFYLSSPVENGSLSRVAIIHEGDSGVQVEIPYKLSFPEKELIVGKYVSILGDGISMSTGEAEQDFYSNNSTTADNNKGPSSEQESGIYGNTVEQGIGSDWTKLYWAQSLTTNGTQLLVNNSVCEGRLANYSSNSSTNPGVNRAGNLHDDTEEGIQKDTTPDIVYVYMGTEDRKQIAVHNAPYAAEFEADYRETLQTITSTYGEAEVFCFTTTGFISSAGYRGIGGAGADRLQSVNNSIQKVASEFEHVTVVDIANIITSTTYSQYFPDNTMMITPNYAAHVEIAKVLQEALESQFKVESQVTLNKVGNGTLTITPEKDVYKLGETVEITATPANEQYYLDTLTIGGTPVTVDSEGTYSLTIDKVSYTVESTFRKKIFNDNTLWDLTEQNQGTDINGVTNGTITYTGTEANKTNDARWLYLYGETAGAKEYGDVDIILNVRNYDGEFTNSNTQVKFETAASNGYWFRFVVEETSDGSVKVFRTGPDGLNTSSNPDYTFLDAEIEAYNSDEGINIRVKREGTMFYFCIDGAIKFSFDLSDQIESNTKSAVCIVHDNDIDIPASIPYELYFPTREPLIGRYVSILGDGISMSAGETISSENNSTVGNNNTTGYQSMGIYRDGDLELGIGDDWTRLYWGQSLVENGMTLLVNNSVCEGKVSDAGTGNATTQKAAYDRADQLHADQGTLIGKEPDIIYLYMGTEDRKQLGLQNTQPAQTFEEKYGETLSTITTSYPQAEVFCFTTMAFSNNGQLWGVDTPTTTNPNAAPRMKNANNSIKKVAREYVNVTLVDIADIITTDTFSQYFPLSGTYITPNVDAHTKIAEKLQAALETRFEAEYDITLSSTEKGSVSIEPEKEKYRYGDEVTIVTTPEDENCYFTELKVDGQVVEVDLDGTYSFTVMKANHKVEAVFDEKIALALNEHDTSLFYINDKKTAVADPFVLDNGDGNYYLYGTTEKGLDLHAYKSKDLMTWTEVGSVFRDSSDQDYEEMLLTTVLRKDIWAPEVVKDGDTYYMFFSATPYTDENVTEGNATKQLMVATSKYPDKGFKLVDFTDASSCGEGNTHTIDETEYPHYYVKYLMFEPGAYTEFAGGVSGYTGAIDPHPYVDGDNKYLFWKLEQSPSSICVVEMDNWLRPKWDTKKKVLVAELEEESQCIEAPEVIKHVDTQGNTRYYLTYSMGTYVDDTYQVGVAVADSITGTYTKLTAAQGGILLSSKNLGNANVTGAGHHSFVTVGEQLYIVYHRHDDPIAQGDNRNHAIDEVKWIQNEDGLDVMYVNGPTSTYQPKIGASGYANIAGAATVSGTQDASYLTDGLLSVQKNGDATFMEKINETSIANTTTFTFEFDSAREVGAIMAYNSKNNDTFFKNISRIEMIGEKDGKDVIYYMDDIAVDEAYYDGNVIIPGSAAYAVFDPLYVKTIKITIEVPEGQSSVGISEIKILGK